MKKKLLFTLILSITTLCLHARDQFQPIRSRTSFNPLSPHVISPTAEELKEAMAGPGPKTPPMPECPSPRVKLSPAEFRTHQQVEQRKRRAPNLSRLITPPTTQLPTNTPVSPAKQLLNCVHEERELPSSSPSTTEISTTPSRASSTQSTGYDLPEAQHLALPILQSPHDGPSSELPSIPTSPVANSQLELRQHMHIQHTPQRAQSAHAPRTRIVPRLPRTRSFQLEEPRSVWKDVTWYNPHNVEHINPHNFARENELCWHIYQQCSTQLKGQQWMNTLFQNPKMWMTPQRHIAFDALFPEKSSDVKTLIGKQQVFLMRNYEILKELVENNTNIQDPKLQTFFGLVQYLDTMHWKRELADLQQDKMALITKLLHDELLKKNLQSDKSLSFDELKRFIFDNAPEMDRYFALFMTKKYILAHYPHNVRVSQWNPLFRRNKFASEYTIRMLVQKETL